MKKAILNLLFVGLLIVSCNGQTNAKYESIAAVNFAEKIKIAVASDMKDYDPLMSVRIQFEKK